MAHKHWPKNPAIYQIYPRSFLDTTGSGIGDLDGVRRKLDYIASLNVDAIWLSPIYVSPWVDGGYDVADHLRVHPALGTEDSVKRLIDDAHERGLKIILDQVLNHTSDQSDWFQKSINREDGFDDWYIWKDAKPDGSMPNNWQSFFGGPAWTWNALREQYYRHQFLPQAPNLNMRHPGVQAAHRDQMRYWRDLGVDGFRLDVVSAYLCDTSFADNPVASPEVAARNAGPDFLPYSRQDHRYDMLCDEAAEYSAMIREWAGEACYLIGEVNVGNGSIELARQFTQPGRLDMAYTVDIPEYGFTAENYHAVLSQLDGSGRIGFWLSSHDQARQVTAHGDGSDHDARFIAVVCGAMPGPWLIYQGEELGLPQPRLSKEETTDPFDLRIWPLGDGREGPRVPIPWTEGNPYRGFTDNTPWLPMRWDRGLSVAAQEQQADSVLAFYRQLVDVRAAAGWADATSTKQTCAGDILRMTITTEQGDFYLIANFGASDADNETMPATKPLIASGSVPSGIIPGRTAAIWQGCPSD